MSIPEFSVKRRITVFMMVLILVLFGLISYTNIGQDLIPDLEFPVMSVVTVYSGAKSEQVEKLLTKPLEEVLVTLDDVERTTSVSQEGMSIINIEFKWGTNIDLTAADARAKINQVKVFLPADAEDSIVLKFDPTQMPVVVYAVMGPGGAYQLKKHIDDVVVPQIEQVSGVAMAMSQGGEIREIRVEVNRAVLASFGLTLGDIIRAIQVENMDDTGGNILVGPKENLVTVKGEFRSPEEIGEVTVAVRPGRPIKVKDVARVLDDYKDQRYRLRVNGSDSAVFLAVLKQSGANTATTSKLVKEKIEELKPQLMTGVEFLKIMDVGEIITRITARTSENALMGALLAIAFVWLFLRNWRPTLIIFLAIPISVLTAFIGMYALGYTFNLMTMGGLALGVGMLIDNAVVVVENTYRHLEMGKSRADAAMQGTTEVDSAIFASTMTTVVVFIPMVLVAGVASRMARPLAFTIVIALCASLFVAITIVPAMTATLFRRHSQEELAAARAKMVLFPKASAAYRAVLDYILNKGLLVLGAVVLLIAGAVAISGNMGGEFIPSADQPFLLMMAELPVGSTLEETENVVSAVADYASAHKDEMGLITVMTSIGVYEDDPYASAQGMNAKDVNGGMMMLSAHYKGEGREMVSSEIENRLREQVPKIDVEGVRVEFQDPFGGMTSTSGETSPIVVKIFGDDMQEIMDTAYRVRDIVATVAGIVDAKVSFSEGKPEKTFRIKRELAAQHGLTTSQVASELRTALDGRVIGRYRESDDEYDLLVRFREKDRDALEKLMDLNIATPTGALLPLGQVVEEETSVGPLQIIREDRRRKVSVTAKVVGRDPVGAVKEIREKLASVNRELVAKGGFLAYGGTFKDYVDTVDAMTWAFAAAVLLVYMVMAAQFESLSHPLVVMVTVPLGIVGVVLGLALFGKTLSMPAMLGFVILVGIVVNNAIVMIDFVNLLRRRDGMEKREAIINGAVTRLRPILITSLTTVGGMAPMALSRSQGSEMRSPMAIAVACGLLFGMLLTLFVIPTVYYYVDGWAERLRKALARILYRGEPEELGPVVEP
ncbi:MAG: efflux RND transporter permease subunit [Planctomycetes bacterium]|nr:efflux RND transporter permease subunit [Planctomycetota bacterium]